MLFFLSNPVSFCKVINFQFTLSGQYLFYLEIWTYFGSMIVLMCNLLVQNDLQN